MSLKRGLQTKVCVVSVHCRLLTMDKRLEKPKATGIFQLQKSNRVLTHATMWMNSDIMLSGKSQTQRPHVQFHVCETPLQDRQTQKR
jgi:hypothetical protein